jgi:hypothetical protein
MAQKKSVIELHPALRFALANGVQPGQDFLWEGRVHHFHKVCSEPEPYLVGRIECYRISHVALLYAEADMGGYLLSRPVGSWTMGQTSHRVGGGPAPKKGQIAKGSRWSNRMIQL